MSSFTQFDESAFFNGRLFRDLNALTAMIRIVRAQGQRIVLTSGSFDLSHIGHMRYLWSARRLGDFVIVGIDSDEKVRSRKGEYRPVIPENERAEMVLHNYADVVFIKPAREEKWALIKAVCPDVLLISQRVGYDDEQQKALSEYCGEICNLPSQAATSTSASVRRLQMETLVPCLTKIRDMADQMMRGIHGESE